MIVYIINVMPEMAEYCKCNVNRACETCILAFKILTLAIAINFYSHFLNFNCLCQQIVLDELLLLADL